MLNFGRGSNHWQRQTITVAGMVQLSSTQRRPSLRIGLAPSARDRLLQAPTDPRIREGWRDVTWRIRGIQSSSGAASPCPISFTTKSPGAELSPLVKDTLGKFQKGELQKCSNDKR